MSKTTSTVMMSETMFVHSKHVRPDGSFDTFYTQEVEAKRKPLWWQERDLSFTATGYGRRIPTDRMVRFNGKWRRVYCCIYSNAGTCYIGRFDSKATEQHIVSD